MHEWLRTVLMVSFACVFLGPLAAGVGASRAAAGHAAEFIRAVDRPPSGDRRARLGRAGLWLVLPVPAAFAVTGAVAKVQGLPGLPGPTDLMQLLTAELLDDRLDEHRLCARVACACPLHGRAARHGRRLRRHHRALGLARRWS